MVLVTPFSNFYLGNYLSVHWSILHHLRSELLGRYSSMPMNNLSNCTDQRLAFMNTTESLINLFIFEAGTFHR